MIRLDNVSKFYYSKGVISSGFSKVSLNFDMGEFVAITGESGSGKSTLLNVISGLDTYEEGEMYIDGSETSHYTATDFENYRRKYIGNIFQSFNLINSYTVYQNIELVLLLNGGKAADVKKTVNELIEKVGLKDYKNTKASKLSGGQKQRVSIARALAKDTPIIIADEPTGNLDTESAAGIIELLSEIAKDKLVIIVTHNYDQVEPYITRKIKMHDGKILEDTKLRPVKSAEEKQGEQGKVSLEKSRRIRPLAELKLGVRNAFNIPVKFILLAFVFAFVTLALTAELSMFKEEEFQTEASGYNYYFNVLSENRIIIKKSDKSEFSEEDYAKIEKLENIESIAKNDLLVDFSRYLDAGDNFSFYANFENISNYPFDSVDVGRMPEADNEIIIVGKKNSHNLSANVEEVLNTEVVYETFSGADRNKNKVKIVGFKLVDNITDVGNYADGVAYVSDYVLKRINDSVNEINSTTWFVFEGESYVSDDSGYMNTYIYPNESIKSGEVYVPESLLLNTEKGAIIGKNIDIHIKNMYFEDSYTAKITRFVTRSNFKSLTGITTENYAFYSDGIFISAEDYSKLFATEPYQSSVFVSNPLKIAETAQALEDMGITPLVVKDLNVQQDYTIIIRIVSTVITLGLAVALFFISYFVIRIILKSRNVYYSTARMLGADVRTARGLLIIDLLTDANLAFFASIGFLKLLDLRFASNPLLSAIRTYMEFGDFAAIYALVIAISLLISIRYSRSLFKKSSITTYNEEV